MPLKWKLFDVFNYLFLLGFGFLLFKAIQFITTEYDRQEDSLRFTSLFLGILVIFFNSVLNIYIFHQHMPDKPLSVAIKKLHLVSLVLFIIAIIILLVSIFPEIRSNDQYANDERSYEVFILAVFWGILIVGGYIAFCQLTIRKYIQERSQLSINKIIDEIGSEE